MCFRARLREKEEEEKLSFRETFGEKEKKKKITFLIYEASHKINFSFAN